MFSKIVRRTHMYLALFFMPWMFVYALSTIAMNHREYFRGLYGGELVRWEKEQEQTYPGTFSENADAKLVASQILSHLSLDAGAYSARKSPDRGSFTIFRDDPIIPRRITYTPANGKLVVERQTFRAPVFLERMHRRRGFQSDSLLNDLWGVTVDLVILAMVFWALSGLWMWWELRATRRLGGLCFVLGLGLFLFFFFTI